MIYALIKGNHRLAILTFLTWASWSFWTIFALNPFVNFGPFFKTYYLADYLQKIKKIILDPQGNIVNDPFFETKIFTYKNKQYLIDSDNNVYKGTFFKPILIGKKINNKISFLDKEKNKS